MTPATFRSHEDFDSDYVQPRQVDIWLPPGYSDDEDRRYPVLYMHDGQNLFSGATSYGGKAWEVDAAIERLLAEDAIPGVIIVGIWNTELRWPEYMIPAPFENVWCGAQLRAAFETERGSPPIGDAYLRFIVEELKPFIDERYPTRPDRDHTLVMGSSMGGLISIAALCTYPEVFGGAGCLSTHWVAAEGIMVDYLPEVLPPPGDHRIYFDHGTVALDAQYPPYQARVNAHVRAAGYTEGEDWITRSFEGADHSESAWRERVHIPLRFLLGQR
jgi:predicted alpha/beta superfamily hydrolase